MPCVDVNECRYYHGVCAHKCENTEGSYRCSCTSGFQLSYDGTNCDGNVALRPDAGSNTKCSEKNVPFSSDVDECLARPCSHTCVNVFGSYRCHCHPGYQLSNTDGITCEGDADCGWGGGGLRPLGELHQMALTAGFFFLSDVDECALPPGVHTCSYRCTNVQGSYYCSCPPAGYILAPNGQTCNGLRTTRCLLCVDDGALP